MEITSRSEAPILSNLPQEAPPQLPWEIIQKIFTEYYPRLFGICKATTLASRFSIAQEIFPTESQQILELCLAEKTKGLISSIVIPKSLKTFPFLNPIRILSETVLRKDPEALVHLMANSKFSHFSFPVWEAVLKIGDKRCYKEAESHFLKMVDDAFLSNFFDSKTNNLNSSLQFIKTSVSEAINLEERQDILFAACSLTAAYYYENEEVVECLLEKYPKIDQQLICREALIYHIKKGNLEACQFYLDLLNKQLSPDDLKHWLNNGCEWAQRKNRSEIVRYLLEYRDWEAMFGEYFLSELIEKIFFLACVGHNADLIQWLKNKYSGKDLDIDQGFEYACNYQIEEIVQQFLPWRSNNIGRGMLKNIYQRAPLSMLQLLYQDPKLKKELDSIWESVKQKLERDRYFEEVLFRNAALFYTRFEKEILDAPDDIKEPLTNLNLTTPLDFLYAFKLACDNQQEKKALACLRLIGQTQAIKNYEYCKALWKIVQSKNPPLAIMKELIADEHLSLHHESMSWLMFWVVEHLSHLNLEQEPRGKLAQKKLQEIKEHLREIVLNLYLETKDLPRIETMLRNDRKNLRLLQHFTFFLCCYSSEAFCREIQLEQWLKKLPQEKINTLLQAAFDHRNVSVLKWLLQEFSFSPALGSELYGYALFWDYKDLVEVLKDFKLSKEKTESVSKN